MKKWLALKYHSVTEWNNLMFKKSVLATSLAILLSGCGSDSSNNSNTSESGFTITGFDGYLQNAVYFIDKDDSGSFNNGDELLGLSDNEGKIKLENSPDEPVSLQTLVVGGLAQNYLASLNPSYANTYTTDTDRPSQPLGKEYVLQTTLNSKVVSPLTDLVVLEMANGADNDTAIANIRAALELDNDADLFVDFVSGENADPKLHKTAQILADSKAENPHTFNQNPSGFAQDATLLVKTIPTEKLSDPNFRGTVDGDLGSTEPVPNGSKTYVNSSIYNSIQNQFNDLDLVWGYDSETPITLLEADISQLFKDSDTSEQLTELLTVVNTDNQSIVVNKDHERIGIVAYIRDSKLFIGMNSSDNLNKAGKFHIEVKFDSEIDGTNTHSAIFTFEVAPSENMPPQISSLNYERIQAQVYKVDLFSGIKLESDLFIDVGNLFEDHGEDIAIDLVNANNLNGLGISLNNEIVQISGTPTGVANKDELSFTISGTAGDKTTDVVIRLPEIKSAPHDISVLEDKLLYRSVVNIYANIRKCEVIKLSGGKIYSMLGENKQSCPTEIPTETIGNYQINNGQLVVFSDKYPEDDAIARTLLAYETRSDNFNSENVTHYLISNSVSPQSEMYAIEYFDYPRYVEIIVKETDVSSWFATMAPSYLKIDGSYKTLWVGVKTNSTVEFQGASAADITCNSITSYYDFYEIGQLVQGQYQKLSKNSVADVCQQNQFFDDITSNLVNPVEYENGTFIFTVTPIEGMTGTPIIERTWLENRY